MKATFNFNNWAELALGEGACQGGDAPMTHQGFRRLVFARQTMGQADGDGLATLLADLYAVSMPSRVGPVAERGASGEAPTLKLRCLTYNIHACVGADGCHDPWRIARVIEGVGPDIAALQEVDVGQSRSCHLDQAQFLAEQLDMHVHFTSARQFSKGHYGIALLSRFQVTVVEEHRLPQFGPDAEPRVVQLLLIDGRLLAVHTHLSVLRRERNLQALSLMDVLLANRSPNRALILLGDLNAVPLSFAYRTVARKLRDAQCDGAGRRRGTFPSSCPLFRIDHIFVDTAVSVRDCQVIDGRLARRASDHLPLFAELTATSVAA